MVDAIAREIGREPHDVRGVNLVRPEQMPYDNVTDKHFDSGDYPQLLRMAVEAIDVNGVRARQRHGESDGRLIGLGMSIFSEQTDHRHDRRRQAPRALRAGLRASHRDGQLEIRAGIMNIGQELETTLAQIGSEILGLDLQDIQVKLGDTETSPYSSGAWGSRGMIWAGGATAQACKELAARVARIGAALLQTDKDSVSLRDNCVFGPSGSVSLRAIAQAYYLSPSELPNDIDTHGLEVTGGFSPSCITGIHTGAAHAAVVAVDPETGAVEILDYVVAEDAGTLVNPMIVDGQIFGGTAQGIGSALYEQMPFDKQGQPLASTLADYLLPSCAEVPNIRVLHMETPSPYTEFGIKGVGEGGAIGPAAAIANAVNDALRPLQVEITEIPITPRRILQALAARRGAN